MNWDKTAAFCRARMGELTDPDRLLLNLGERILHSLEAGLQNQLMILDDHGSAAPLPFSAGMLEAAKNLTLELALLWDGHPDFPTCWERP